jgi:hypothetical protein
MSIVRDQVVENQRSVERTTARRHHPIFFCVFADFLLRKCKKTASGPEACVFLMPEINCISPAQQCVLALAAHASGINYLLQHRRVHPRYMQPLAFTRHPHLPVAEQLTL